MALSPPSDGVAGGRRAPGPSGQGLFHQFAEAVFLAYQTQRRPDRQAEKIARDAGQANAIRHVLGPTNLLTAGRETIRRSA
jgi:hypothetical protein